MLKSRAYGSIFAYCSSMSPDLYIFLLASVVKLMPGMEGILCLCTVSE